MGNLYNYHAVDSLVSHLNDIGYECNQLDEGVLGSGSWICVPPDDEHYYFIINEVPLNCWSSAHTIKRRMKLSKADQKRLQEFYERGDDN